MSARTPAPPLAVRVLGPLEVEREGQAIAVAGRSERALLAFVAREAGTTVSVERLADFLWGEAPPRTADKTLQTYISRLRKALGSDEIIRRREAGYALDVQVAVDALQFFEGVQQARKAQRDGDAAGAAAWYRRALALWRSDTPAETPDTPLGQAWRRELSEARLEALEAALTIEVRNGAHVSAAAELERLVVAEPYREPMWALLMEALARSGRTEAALATYQRARDRMVEDLGLDPSPHLQELQQRIASQDRDLGPVAASADVGAQQPRVRPVVRVPPPRPGTPLVGRAAERRQVEQALASYRIVTLTGMGGVGKTRLALDASTSSPATILWELATVDDPAAVVHSLATAFGVEGGPSRDPLDAILGAIGDRDLLLIADNCEHLISDVRRPLQTLVSRCPHLRVLATSRQPLGVDEEAVIVLRPLSAVGDRSDAANLFLDRARRGGAIVPDDEATRAVVADICSGLDGLPLAIELAAARVRSMSLQELRSQLTDRFGLLQEPRLLGGRERTLEGTVEWSYRLLPPHAQMLFRRLSVFAGSFAAGAAADVCGFGGLRAADVPLLLASLVDRSLIERAETAGTSRFRMLETLRQYGSAALEPDEGSRLRAAHARWVCDRSEELARRRFTPDEAAAVDAFASELDNIRSALRWSFDAGEVAYALRIAAAVHVYALLGQHTELFHWTARIAERFGDSGHALVPEVLGSAAIWRGLSGDDRGAAVLETQIVACEQRGGMPLGPVALAACAGIRARHGDFEAAESYLDRLRSVDRDGGFSKIVIGDVAIVEAYRGRLASARSLVAPVISAGRASGVPSLVGFASCAHASLFAQDQPDDAVAHLRRGLALAGQVRARMLEQIALYQLSTLAVQASDAAVAVAALRDAIGRWQRDGAWRMEWATLHNVMELLGRIGWHEPLVVLHAASTASTTAPPVDGAQRHRLSDALGRAEGALPAETVAVARQRGRGMTDGQALAYAQQLLDRAATSGPGDPEG